MKQWSMRAYLSSEIYIFWQLFFCLFDLLEKEKKIDWMFKTKKSKSANRQEMAKC